MKSLTSFTLIFSLLFVVLLSFQCKKETACTMEFRTVSIQVIGEQLDDFFTIRNINGDTLRYELMAVDQDAYPVLDDNAMVFLKNKTENFTFIGILNGQKVVEENFVIKADECHIEKVSGAVTVYL
jgi:hypothetical protein